MANKYDKYLIDIVNKVNEDIKASKMFVYQ